MANETSPRFAPVRVSCGSIIEVRRPTLISLGYEGRSVSELVDELRRQSVAILVDVLLTPLSRKPGMSKRRLAAALGEAGIGYVHLPALGNPRDNRDAFRSGDPSSRQRFRSLLHDQGAVHALDHIAELLEGGAVAMLCFERSHEHCHRHLVAEAVLDTRPSVELVAI
jgi:uncharacterized protein (DUF488 family)